MKEQTNQYGDKMGRSGGREVIDELNADFGFVAFQPDSHGEHSADLILRDGSVLPRKVHVGMGRAIDGGFVIIDNMRTPDLGEFEDPDYQICRDPRLIAAICRAAGVRRECEENGYPEGEDPFTRAKTLGVIPAPAMDEARKLLAEMGVPMRPDYLR